MLENKELSKKVLLKPHNLEPYNDILKAFESNSKIIYVAGTGTGKSYILFALLEKIEGRILYIVPQHQIHESISNYNEFALFKDRIDFSTYNAFTSASVTKRIIESYSFIVIDECHHLGSEKYGASLVNYMRECPKDKRFIGLTATKKRMDNIEVSQYFDVEIDGYSILDAIRAGIMPQIQYEILSTDIKMEDYKSLATDKDYKYFFDFDEICSNISKFLENPKNVRNKWIVYFNNISELNKSKDKVAEIFKGYKIIVIHTQVKDYQKMQKQINVYEKVVVLSVNMFVEGSHIDGIKGIILFRNVTSIVTFQQMMGRIMSVGDLDPEPIFIDASRTAGVLFYNLMMEERANNTNENITDKEVKEKEACKISINGINDFDILQVLKILYPSAYEKELMRKNANKAFTRYLKMGGKLYNDFAQMKAENKEDFYTAKSLCSFYGTRLSYFLDIMKSVEEID